MHDYQFFIETLSWHEPGCMLAMLDVLSPLGTRRLQFGETGILWSQTRPGGDQVSFGDFHRVFYSTFGGGIIGHAGVDGGAIPASSRHDPLVAHRQITHMIHRHGSLIISQYCGRDTTDHSETGVQSTDHAGHLLIK